MNTNHGFPLEAFKKLYEWVKELKRANKINWSDVLNIASNATGSMSNVISILQILA